MPQEEGRANPGRGPCTLTASCSLVRRSPLGRAPDSTCPDIPAHRHRSHPPGYISPCSTDSNGRISGQTFAPGTGSNWRGHSAKQATHQDLLSSHRAQEEGAGVPGSVTRPLLPSSCQLTYQLQLLRGLHLQTQV
uniref:Uncharacterized protein n=1 Tax=Terrapene triunguis TaxID=2587831 RepID=A0A674II50_9SAUR